MTPAIETQSLVKTFGSVRALDGLSLSVEAGSLFGLLGPNGAGKTTTMAVLTGQLLPDSGSASVLGTAPTADPIGVRAQVGILPETESPPSFLTPREYFDFVGAIRDLPPDVVEERAATWAERLAFAEKLDTLSTDLSRGQKQKVMIAGAFLHEPAAVFIDEPLSNLDPIIQERVKSYLREYRAAGNTVMLSTHNVEVAADLCSRVGIVHRGQLVAETAPGDLDPTESLLDVFVDEVEERVADESDGDAQAADSTRPP